VRDGQVVKSLDKKWYVLFSPRDLRPCLLIYWLAAEPLRINIDVGPFPTTSNKDAWAWGLIAGVEGSTTYDCFDDDVVDSWMKMTATYRQRLYLPLRGEGKKNPFFVSSSEAVVSVEEARSEDR